MNKKITITIPEFLSIENYQKLQVLEHLSDIDKLIETIHIIGGIDKEEIKYWSIESMSTVSRDLSNTMNNQDIFYPVFEIKGVLYGYQHLNKMSVGEYMDLDRLIKNPHSNLHEIMAILYRPIKKHRFKDLTFRMEHKTGIMKQKFDNVFDWYELEEYDSRDRKSEAEIMKDLPIHFALGALGFFLGSAQLYLSITNHSSTDSPTMKRMELKATRQNLKHLMSIGAGLRQFIHSPKQIYSV